MRKISISLLLFIIAFLFSSCVSTQSTNDSSFLITKSATISITQATISSLVKPTIGLTPSIKVSPTPTSVPTYPIGQLPTVKVEEDWITYKNDIAEYEITIPHDANIKGELLQGVSEGYKLHEGMTFEEFIKQRDQKYGDRLCVGIAYKNGFVEIESFKVKDLGDHCLFGSLAGEQQYPISETITIKGIIYEAKGSRVEGKTGAYEESLRFSLSDDTLIVFGSITNDLLEYQQYLKNVRKTILNIIESYTVVN